MTKLIPILSGRCLVVELPEGAETVHVAYNNGFWYLIYFTHNGEILTRKRLPKGNWRIIGMLSEVREDDLYGVVPSKESIMSSTGILCVDYSRDELYTLGSRIESLESAILAEGYFLDKNPIQTVDDNYAAIGDYYHNQSRVLDRSRCLLLGREV